MKLYILIDTSGSMKGTKIGSVNDAMENLLSAFSSFPISISVLLFSREAHWVYPTPISISEFKWKSVDANGMTSLGKACIELFNSINQHCHKEYEVITSIVISDGNPTDDYDGGIMMLEQNQKFVNSNRFAIALEEADLVILERFTGNKTHVYKVAKLNELTTIILNTIEVCNKDDSTFLKQPSMEVGDDSDEWD